MTKLTEPIFIDRFSSLDDLKGIDRRDPKKILAALAAAKRFSCFEVDDALAGPITRLLQKSGWATTRLTERVRDADGQGWHDRDLYPWAYVDLTDAGRRALGRKA
mgnify:CR=1 FL=1